MCGKMVVLGAKKKKGRRTCHVASDDPRMQRGAQTSAVRGASLSCIAVLPGSRYSKGFT